jgi:hypothetical protein
MEPLRAASVALELRLRPGPLQGRARRSRSCRGTRSSRCRTGSYAGGSSVLRICGRDGEGNAPALPGPAGLPRTNRHAARGRLRTRRCQSARGDPGRMNVGRSANQEAAVRVRLRLPLLPRIVGADLRERGCAMGPEQVPLGHGSPGLIRPTPRRVSMRSVHVVLRSRADVTAEAGRLRRAARPDSADEPSALSDRDDNGGRDATAATDGMNWSSATLSAISRAGRLTSMAPSVPGASAAAHGLASALRRAARARCPRRQVRLSAAAVVDAGRQPRRRVMDLLIAATPHAHGARPSSRKPADFAGLDEQLAVVKARTISPPESDLDTAHAAVTHSDRHVRTAVGLACWRQDEAGETLVGIRQAFTRGPRT